MASAHDTDVPKLSENSKDFTDETLTSEEACSSIPPQEQASINDASDEDIVAKLASKCRVDGSRDPESDIEVDKTLDWFIDEEELKLTDKDLKQEDKLHMRDAANKLKIEGNDLFAKGLCPEAARVYTTALRTCPYSYGNERAILYSNRAACFLHMEEKEEGVMDCSKALEYNPNYLKAILRRALLYEKNDKLDEALADYNKVLELEPRNPKALEACTRLPDQIKERNEKLKTEMLGKLKDLGNMILRPFGLSTDNFKMQQDPNTGSYSVNMTNK